jgi:hypothetical protein
MAAIFKWRLTHKADVLAIKGLIEELGFEVIPDNPHRFVKALVSLREIKVGVGSEEVLIYVHKAEEAASETYFEYLFEAGHLFGRLGAYIEALPVRGQGEVEGDVASYDEDLDGDDE